MKTKRSIGSPICYTEITKEGEFVEKSEFLWYDDNENLFMDDGDIFFFNGEQVARAYWEKHTKDYREGEAPLEWINWETGRSLQEEMEEEIVDDEKE